MILVYCSIKDRANYFVRHRHSLTGDRHTETDVDTETNSKDSLQEGTDSDS